jgi:hypothetical protein
LFKLERQTNLSKPYFQVFLHFLANKFNFNKYGRSRIDSLGVEYDYGSIMHYGKRDFAKWPWQTTIRPKKAGVSIGQRKGLSVLDVKQANLLYRC